MVSATSSRAAIFSAFAQLSSSGGHDHACHGSLGQLGAFGWRIQYSPNGLPKVHLRLRFLLLRIARVRHVVETVSAPWKYLELGCTEIVGESALRPRQKDPLLRPGQHGPGKRSCSLNCGGQAGYDSNRWWSPVREPEPERELGVGCRTQLPGRWTWECQGSEALQSSGRARSCSTTPTHDPPLPFPFDTLLLCPGPNLCSGGCITAGGAALSPGTGSLLPAGLNIGLEDGPQLVCMHGMRSIS